VKAISLFSGVGGFDLGFERAGIETVLQVENDNHCLAILERHWPDVERITDVRDVGDRGLPREAERRPRGGAGSAGGDDVHAPSQRSRACDLIYGGFPCQDVSVAGKRAGLDGDRSGLWFEFHRIVRELRPRWVCIENVPGLLSSNGGADFAVILSGLDELGFDAAWAVLDAQHFGVAQRRRRVFIVGGPRGRSAEQVLSLCESCGGNPETGETPREGTTGALSAGTLRAGGVNAGNNPAGGYLADIAYAVAPARGTGDGHGNSWNSTYVANPLGAHHRRDDLDHDTYVPVMGALDTKLGDKMWLENQLIEKYGTMDAAGAGVRRLTPTECERLQGFPDGWTDGQADSHRYRQMSNAVAVPVAEWIGHRLVAVDTQ
jgi:DNA (cytosine-5)-methyltransferase 1